MSLADVIANLQSKALAMTGIKAAPDYPPEDMSTFPFAICYPRTGEVNFGGQKWANNLDTVYMDLHISRAILPKAVEKAIPYRDTFAKKLMDDPTLGGTAKHITGFIVTFGELSYAGQTTIGWRFEISFMTHTEVST